MLWVSLWVGVWLCVDRCVGRWVFSESQISLFVLSLACPLFGDAVVRVSCGGGGDAPPPPPPNFIYISCQYRRGVAVKIIIHKPTIVVKMASDTTLQNLRGFYRRRGDLSSASATSTAVEPL